ncbi:MAG: lysoplasmalogenase [Rubrivivax sp.]|nr:lysoplasmalogenase [Rubrivivax sp.]
MLLVTHPSWLFATVGAAALAIAAAPWALNAPWLAFVFKPLATLLIIALAWPRGCSTPTLRRWVLAGLLLSLVGDVALLWPQQGFLPGLVAFLLAHLAYLVAFTRVQRLAARVWPFVLYGVVGGLILAWLWAGVPAGLRVPVVMYLIALASMAAQALVLWRAAPAAGAARRLALGGALFVASDALLAVNRFAGPLPMASLWVLATYWVAQVCIVSWLAPPPRAD